MLSASTLRLVLISRCRCARHRLGAGPTPSPSSASMASAPSVLHCGLHFCKLNLTVVSHCRCARHRPGASPTPSSLSASMASASPPTSPRSHTGCCRTTSRCCCPLFSCVVHCASVRAQTSVMTSAKQPEVARSPAAKQQNPLQYCGSQPATVIRPFARQS